MKRLNISFTNKHIAQLNAERLRTGIPTSTLIRMLIDKHLAKPKAKR